MYASSRTESYLIAWFRAFYAELVGVKRSIEAAGAMRPARPAAERVLAAAPAGGDGEASGEGGGRADGEAAPLSWAALRNQAPEEDVRRLVGDVHERLRRALDRLPAEGAGADEGKDLPAELLRYARYLLAGFADEVLLHLDWEGRVLWQDHLLEAHLFRTEVAGERFFRIMDAVLQERDAALVDLARIGLVMLALDFQGRYRGGDVEVLDHYRRRLFQYVAGVDPALMQGEAQPFPQAYDHTLTDGEGGLLPDPRQWAWVFGVVVLLLLVVSTVVWQQVSLEVVEALAAIPGLPGGEAP